MVSAEREEYSKLARMYVFNEIELSTLLEKCKKGFAISAVSRALTRYILLEKDEEKIKRAEEGIKSLAKIKIEYVAPEIVRGIIFSINNLNKLEKKGMELNKDRIEFLFSILDSCEVILVNQCINDYAQSYESRINQSSDYETYEKKLNLPGARIMHDYIIKRAKKNEEVQLLEKRSGPREYFSKNIKRNTQETIPKDVLHGYLRALAEIAIRHRDIELIKLYAHFYEFVFYVIFIGGVNTCKKKIEEKDFVEMVDALFSNGSKIRVLNVLFKGLDKGGEEKRNIHIAVLKKLMEIDRNAFIAYYERIKNQMRKDMVENVILNYGSKEIKEAFFDKKMPMPSTGTFKNVQQLKRKT